MDHLVAVVPLRDPGRGKTRLSPSLDPDARAALAGAMLADVVAALRGADLEVVVAAGGPAAAAAAAALSADVVVDPPGTRSLDGAVEHARRRLEPLAGLLVVQADLPALTADDVRAVVDGDDAVVVAPTDDGGTSALLRRPPAVIPTSFGPDSGRGHRRLAEAAGLTPRVVRRPGLARDVDVLADLQALDRGLVGPATAIVLARLRRDASDCA
jgi:2-phospho-L-lactate guanylyltransferase